MLACKQEKGKIVNDALTYSSSNKNSVEITQQTFYWRPLLCLVLQFVYCICLLPNDMSGTLQPCLYVSCCLPVCISCNNVE